MPRGAPSQKSLLCALDKSHVPINDGGSPELSPPFGLSGFPNPRGAKKEDASPLMLDSGRMNLNYLPPQSMDIEEIG